MSNFVIVKMFRGSEEDIHLGIGILLHKGHNIERICKFIAFCRDITDKDIFRMAYKYRGNTSLSWETSLYINVDIINVQLQLYQNLFPFGTGLIDITQYIKGK